MRVGLEDRGRRRRTLVALLAISAIAVAAVLATTASARPAAGTYVLGVSNTLAGNGWREEMICSIKAQALASGVVKDVKIANRNGGPAEQNADLRNLISAGANAIILNPSSATALNPTIAQAAGRGIKVVSIDQRVTAPQAYNATNDQTAYGRLGAEWLFKQLLTVKGFHGAAVTNPATIGGVGAAIAIKLLQGKSVSKTVLLKPQVWDNKTSFGRKQIKENYSPSRPPTYSSRALIKPWTTYTRQQLFACKGP